MEEPDIVEYPDSGKLGVFAGESPGGRDTGFLLRKILSADAEVDYREGE